MPTQFKVKSILKKKEDMFLFLKESPWLKISQICFYLLVALTPLFFLPLTTAPVEINKLFLATVLTGLGLICYFIEVTRAGKFIYPKSKMGLAVILFLVALAISAFFSQAKLVSLFGYLIQADSLLGFLIAGLAFLLTAVVFSSDQLERAKQLRRLAFYFFISLAILSLFSLAQLLGQFILPWDFAQQSNFNPLGTMFSWAIYSAFGLVIIIATLFNFKLTLKKKILLAILGLLLTFELVIVNYPSIWLALAAVILLLAAYKFASLPRLNPVLVIVISLFLFLGLTGQSLPTFVQLPLEIRPNLMATWSVIQQTLSWPRLLIGSGPATFGYDFTLHRPLELNQTNFWPLRFTQGFSFLTTLLATSGLLGILALILIIWTFIRQLIKSSISAEVLTISAGVIFLISGWLFAPTSLNQILLIFIGLGLIIVFTEARKEIAFSGFPKLINFPTLFILIILIVGGFSFIFVLSKKYSAAIYYEKGLRLVATNANLDKTLIQLDRASRLDPEQDWYLRSLSQILLLRIDELITQKKADALSQQQIQTAIALAINRAQNATQLNPIDSLNWENLASVYEKIIPFASGADSLAEENYKKAMELDPKNPQELVNLSRSLILTADIYGANDADLKQEKLNKAETYLEDSLKLKSDYAPAHFLLAATALREGKTQEAITSLESAKQSAPFDTGLAFQLGLIYYQDQQFDQAKAEFERTITLNENYANARYFLGLIYDKEGRKEEAIKQFEKIEKLNPDNQEIKKILANLRKGGSALEGIVPPATPPAERVETPVSEENR